MTIKGLSKEEDEIMTVLDPLFSMLADKWLLRMQCHSFVMIINKTTGKYANLYYKSFKTRAVVDMFVSKLEMHKNFKK